MRLARREVLVSVLALCGMLANGQALAQERGTPEEAKAMVMKGLEHIKKVGVEAAFKDFNNDKDNWVKKDIYMFANNLKGVQFVHGANPRMVGKDLWEVRDANGKALFQEFTTAANKGSGWVEYEWAHPQTKKIETKASFISKVPGTDYYIGAGAYK